jgi:hypothetical protein
MIRIKRPYEPAAPTDGHRFLVERLWPRGLKKEKLAADWVKDVAPSTGLRLWFGIASTAGKSSSAATGPSWTAGRASGGRWAPRAGAGR